MVDQLTSVFRDIFGIVPNGRAIGYVKPYPDHFDLVPYPPKYRVPDFTKFSGQDGTTTIEHIDRYIAQLGMAQTFEELRVRLFSLSLVGSAFSWYSSLLARSIHS